MSRVFAHIKASPTPLLYPQDRLYYGQTKSHQLTAAGPHIFGQRCFHHHSRSVQGQLIQRFNVTTGTEGIHLCICIIHLNSLL